MTMQAGNRSRRYRVTAPGIRTVLCYQRTYARVSPALAGVFDANAPRGSRLKRTVEVFDREIDRLWEGRDLAAQLDSSVTSVSVKKSIASLPDRRF